MKNLQVKMEAIPNPGVIFYNSFVKRILSKSELEISQEVVHSINRGVLVDVGSGTGFLSIEIAKKAPELSIYGIDLSKKMVEISSGHAKRFNNVQFQWANATQLPFEENSIDLIISTGSFHHWKHPFKVFNECYRILKNNREAWIYDGCYNPPSRERAKLKREYGILKYFILTRIQKLHGFEWIDYKTRIKRLLEQTNFKTNFRMELKNGWMKLILKKRGILS
ncbi:MAG: methyltransferase domain-containing protein [Candidatus Heimdallarchaeota archaeon]